MKRREEASSSSPDMKDPAIPSSASIVGYAILRANFNSGLANYLDNFIPFAVDVVRSMNPNPADASDVSARVREKFGIVIPTLVSKNVLRRALRLGRLRDAGAGRYLCAPVELDTGRSVSADFDKFIRQENEIGNLLLAYARSHDFDGENLLNREECIRLIAKYVDVHALPLLKSAVQGATAPARLEPGENYLVSCFVAEAHEQNELLFSQLVEVTKGATLAAVLRMDVSSLQASLNSLSIYIDAPIVIDLLGYHGPAAQSASVELVALAKDLGAKVCVFAHTVREAKAVLNAAKDQLRTGHRVNETFRAAVYFLEGGMSAADVEIAIQRFDEQLQGAGIRERPKPDDYYKYGLDESLLESNISSAIRYANGAALRYDVDSISAVHMLREGGGGETLERSRAVFVTGNRDLVFAANKSREIHHEYPLALVDSTLASLLWVRGPSMAEDLPAKRITATAWAGMQPEPGRWIHYLGEADRLEERGELAREDAILLRLSAESKRELMREAAGDPENFAAIPPSELVKRVKEGLAAPLIEKVKKLKQEAEFVELKHLDDVSTAQQEVRDANAQIKSLRQRLDAAESDSVLTNERNAQQLDRLRQRADRDVRRGVNVVLWILGGGLIVASILAWISPPRLDGTVTPAAVLPLLVIGSIVLLINISTQVVGGSLREWLGHLRGPITTALYSRRLDRLGLTAHE